MDDDGFSMFTNDDALLPGPSFLIPVDDNAALNLIYESRLEVEDYGYASLPDPGSVLPLDGTLLLDTPPIRGHDIFPHGQPLPPPTDYDTTQISAMVQVPLVEGFDGYPSHQSTSFDHLNLLGFCTTQPSAVVPVVAPHPFTQAPTQEAVTGRERAFGAPKRPFDQPESPMRIEKRLCSIRPKLFPAQASVTGNTNTSSTTPSTPPKPDVKEGNVPASMLGTFRLESSETSACSDKRTRSKRVCLKCQSLRKKCDGIFPCRYCRDPGKGHARKLARYSELPCFDASVEDLELFSFLGPSHTFLLPDCPQISNPTKHTALLQACATLQDAALHFWRDRPSCRMLSALFSFYTLTGIPVCDAHTFFRSPPVLPWRLDRPVRSQKVPSNISVFSFLLAVTQTRTLAKLARSPERDVEVWASSVSRHFFGRVTRLLGKVTRGKASRMETECLGCALAVLLFASEISRTHVLTVVERTLHEIGLRNTGPERLALAVVIVEKYFCGLGEKWEHLRLWTRHWIRKIYGNTTESIGNLNAPINLSILLSSIHLTLSDGEGGVEDQVEDNEYAVKEDNSGQQQEPADGKDKMDVDPLVRYVLNTVVSKLCPGFDEQGPGENLYFSAYNNLITCLAAAFTRNPRRADEKTHHTQTPEPSQPSEGCVHHHDWPDALLQYA